MRSDKTLQGVLCAAAGAACWGFSATCGQLLLGVHGVPFAWTVCLRLAMAAVTFLLVCLVAKRDELFRVVRQPRELARVAVFALCGMLFSQVAFLACIGRTNAGTTTVLERCGLVLVMLIVCAQARRLPHIREIAGVALAIGGTVLVATKGDLGTLAIPADGLLWGVCAACALVCYTMLPVGLLTRWSSLTVTALASCIAAAVANVAVQPWNIPVELTPQIAAAVLAMGVIGTFCSYLLFLRGVALAGPMRAGMVGCIEPVSAMAISALWLGTPVTPADALGCAMIVGMVLLVTQREERPAAVSAETAAAAEDLSAGCRYSVEDGASPGR